VFNKMDRLAPEEQLQLALIGEGVGISALDAGTLEPLLARAQDMLRSDALAGDERRSAQDGDEEGEGVGEDEID
jgi:GTP-binding protein HflX